MKHRIFWLTILLVWAISTQAVASEITIWDNQGNPYESEDQEVEPNAVQGYSAWDLEGMFYENNILSIVGQWDFVHEVEHIGSGDLFISTSGYTWYGEDVPAVVNGGNGTILNNFGYTYVFDVDWDHFAEDSVEGDNILWTAEYTLLAINSNTHLNPTINSRMHNGNPASYASGGTLKSSGTLTISLAENTGFVGSTHYMVSGFDLSPIINDDSYTGSFTAHFTQECGNDVLMGQVPEPATMMLLGIGLLGIGAIGRRLPLKSV